MRVRKIISQLVYYGCVKHFPPSFSWGGVFWNKCRVLCVKKFITSCGKGVRIEKNAAISTKCRIGNCSGIGLNATIGGEVVIGNYVMMGPDCVIHTINHSFSRTDIPMIQQGFGEEQKVIIEDDVWIGSNVIILPGVIIGKGTVIGASSVVSKSIPEYSVVVGNPAKIIRNRKYENL